MEMGFDMERIYKMAPKSTIQSLRARLESGKSIFEIVHDFRLKYGLVSSDAIKRQEAVRQLGDPSSRNLSS